MMSLPPYGFGPGIPNTMQSTMPLHVLYDIKEQI